MKIVLNKSKHLPDWFTIIRAEHDGREWLEKTAPNCSQLMLSERLSPEACIEGHAQEMIELALAIKHRDSVSFKRCAVHFEPDGAHFCSPKNSKKDAVVSVEEADALANQIFAELINEPDTL